MKYLPPYGPGKSRPFFLKDNIGGMSMAEIGFFVLLPITILGWIL